MCDEYRKRFSQCTVNCVILESLTEMNSNDSFHMNQKTLNSIIYNTYIFFNFFTLQFSWYVQIIKIQEISCWMHMIWI